MQTDTAAFEQFVEIPGIDANTYREIYARADQVQINFMDNSEYEVKATQSINVLALVQEDMEVITQVEQFAGQDEGEQRAGLTGYAQVMGNYNTSFLDKLKWDLMYIENYSLFLDFKILLMTAIAIFAKDNHEDFSKWDML